MAEITGTIYIDFETDKPITEDQFNKFKKAIKKLIEDWEMQVYDEANNSGFEANSISPIFIDELECEYD